MTARPSAPYRRQHQALRQLGARLLRVGLRPGARAAEIHGALTLLLAALRFHAAAEAEGLTVTLASDPRPLARARGERFTGELDELEAQLDGFARRWASAEDIARHGVRFRVELLAFLAALGDRLRREERELFPLADSTADCAADCAAGSAPPPRARPIHDEAPAAAPSAVAPPSG